METALIRRRRSTSPSAGDVVGDGRVTCGWHDSRRFEVCVVRLIAAIAFCVLPSAGTAQTWAEAYRTGQYEQAADLLHAMIADPEQADLSNDPEPFHYLALLYARGLGVPPDPIAACTLAHREYGALQQVGPKDLADAYRLEAQISESKRFIDEHCRRLSDSDRLAALSAYGCYAFGMPERVLTVGNLAVRVGRRGIRPADAPDNSARDLGCPALFADLRVTTVQPPADAAPDVKARHFIELFTWRVRLPSDGTRQYLLEWHAHEVLADRVVRSISEVVAAATTWPRPAVPHDLDARVSLEMIRSGHVRWRIAGAPPTRGWLMLPEVKDRR